MLTLFYLLSIFLLPPTHVNYRYDHVEGYGERYLNSSQSLLTGKLTAKVDDGSSPLIYIPTVMYYDYRGRLIQSKGGNHLPGGIEQEYMAYDFVGNTVKRKYIHSPSGGDIQTEEYTYTYDRAGRLQIAKHSLNGAAFVTLNDNAYDGIGNLISVVCRHGNRDIMETCYGYNVRSWLTHINGSFFNQRLYYNDLRANGTNVPSYSGNISGMDWKATSDNVQRGYDFTYDDLSRLTRADYLEQNVRKENCFDTSYEYDKHGNPLRIKRYGQTGTNSYGLIDNLFMTLNGNQLKSVENTDVSPVYNEGTQFKNGTSQSVEYSYDANGALIKDSNKGIEEIRYNFLHLPRRVVFSDGSVVSYVYDADGVKRRTRHINGNSTTVTDYCGNAIYENGVLSKTLTSEGYITLSGSTPTYHYYVKDHLGNNRMVVDQNGTVEQVNHYYPFGGLMSSSANNEVQPYMYNGKELDRKNGLDLYYYSARYMDGVLGRFTTMDPHAEKYYSISPYAYCKNNPINRVDPNGKDDFRFSPLGQITRVPKTRNNGQPDRLFSANGSSIVVQDKNLLPGLTNPKVSVKRQFYSKTTNIEDAVKVFKFAADNTSKEWGLDVYNDGNETYAYIATNINESTVSKTYNLDENKNSTHLVALHSHPNEDGTKGGSSGDLEYAKSSKAPKKAVYHKHDKKLYEFNSKQSRTNTIDADSHKQIIEYMQQ